MPDEHPPEAPVSARARVSRRLLYRGELPPTEAPPGPMTESAWRNVALTLAVILLLGSGAVIIFWPRGTSVPTDGTAVPAAAPTAASTPATSGAAASSPSGVPMPGDIPGWKRTFADDFDGTLKQWEIYEGQPGGDPGGWFRASHVSVADGKVTIKGTRADTPNGNIYATGGMNNNPSFSQAYGRYEIRFRIDEGYGIAFAILLWPSSNTWPPEIDIAEDRGLDRNLLHAALHHGTPSRPQLMQHDRGDVDTTLWHTVGVEWRPGRVDYLFDGEAWHTIESDQVPDVPMVIAIQSQAWFCGGTWSDCPNSTTPPVVNLEVDWVVAYEAAGA